MIGEPVIRYTSRRSSQLAEGSVAKPRARREVRARRQLQRSTREQDVHVAAERARVAAIDGEHHAVDRDVFGPRAVGDRPERLGPAHGAIRAARRRCRQRARRRAARLRLFLGPRRRRGLGSRRRRRRLLRRLRALGRRLGRRGGSIDRAARTTRARGAGLGRRDGRRRGRRGQQHRRIEKDGVLAQPPAARPRRFDEQRNERLDDGLA